MKKFLAIFLLAIPLIAGCSENEQQTTGNEEWGNSVDEPKNHRYEVLAENLEAPWSITSLKILSINHAKSTLLQKRMF